MPWSQGLKPKKQEVSDGHLGSSRLGLVDANDDMAYFKNVLVDSAQMTDSGSKEAFVALLEYAEEVLEVSHVIVCIDKTQSAATKMAIRNFLFLGFQPLAPGHEFLPTNPNLVCFLYTI
jgi:hypothetical protein